MSKRENTVYRGCGSRPHSFISCFHVSRMEEVYLAHRLARRNDAITWCRNQEVFLPLHCLSGISGDSLFIVS
jgi:hypothetical protein